MHEVSLVHSLLIQTLQAAEPLAASAILEIHVSCGPLCGVEPLLVESAFEQLRASYALQHCRLDVEELPLLAKCSDCQSTFEVVEFTFCCPDCRSSHVTITQGDAFRLKRLVVDSDAVPCSTTNSA